MVMLSQFPLAFFQTQKGVSLLIKQLVTILVVIGTIFVIIWEIFHGEMSKLDASTAAIQFRESPWNWCINPSSKISS